MPSIKDLRKRIVSVKNTQQTTRAMKMVSAAKLRRAQEAIHSQRPYAHRMNDLIRLVSSLMDESISSPLVRDESPEANEQKRALLVLVTSDRGLCGAFNGSIIKACQRWMAEYSAKYSNVQIGFIGRKGYDFFKSRQFNRGPYFEQASGKVTFQKAKQVSDALIELYKSNQVDEVKFVYNEFKNAVTQKVLIEDFLPLPRAQGRQGNVSEREREEGKIYLIKPNGTDVLNYLLAKNFSVQAFRILLESQASEHGARMSAMENATKNAGEMIQKLTLQYNKQRQAGITKELLEIIAGSESQKASA